GASHRGLSPSQLAELTAPWLTDDGQSAFYRQIAEADQRFTDEVQDRYAELGLPVHIIWGEQDGWIPVERARELHRMIPGATLEVLAGAGHLVHLDAPVGLAVGLHRWLAAQ
ncbi:alpha/beta fold hydrolase, partial [Georgenia sp. 10Sc9-8]|nr:alpha/beta fold hydrolase [Georgenia halotolerans]